jgi:hypothetical protein
MTTGLIFIAVRGAVRWVRARGRAMTTGLIFIAVGLFPERG